MTTVRMMSIVVVFLGAHSSALADYVVLLTNSESFTEAQVVPDGTEISLDTGEELVLLSDNGDILEMSGPFSGAPQGTQSDEFDIREALAGLIDNPNVMHTRLGSTRGGLGANRTNEDIGVWYLDPFVDGTQCVIEDQVAVLQRTSTEDSLVFEVQRPGIEGTGIVEWAAGEETANWPENIRIIHQGLYVLRRPGWFDASMIYIGLIPKRIADKPETAIAWLAINGCKQQAYALLAEFR